MADEETPAEPKTRTRRPATPKEEPEAPAEKPKAEAPRAPKRAALSDERQRLLRLRREQDDHRPIFGRQAAHRYDRIGRFGSWRRPRGLQSKQRRHYGYRPQVVSIGYRSPAAVRGLAPNGFRPVIVRTEDELGALDPGREAAVIARTVGTRRRLTLEDIARRKGIHVLNPIVTEERES